jgi:hypothetical protein
MRTLWTHTLILLIAAGLFLHQIEAESVWFDEGWSAYAASQNTILAAANADTTNPPLYYTLIYLSAIFTGQSEFGLRWLSYALGMLTVALAGRFGYRLGGHRTAIYATLVAALSGPLLWASQEMRMYTLLALLMAVILIAWEQLRTKPNSAAWVALLLAELAILYTHNTGPVIVIWLNGMTLLAWILNRKPRNVPWIIGQIIVIAGWTPYFITRFLLLTDANSALVRRTPLDLSIWAGFWLAPWEAVTTTPQLWLALATLPAALLMLPALRHEHGRWLWLHLTVLTGGLFMALNLLGNELHGRYLVMLVPIVAGLFAVAVANLSQVMRWGAIAYLVGLCAFNLIWQNTPSLNNDDARAMVGHYADTLKASDTVLAWSYADRYELAYYWDRFGVDVERVTLPEGADMDMVLPLLPTEGDISLNVWYTQRADYRGMMDCLLRHGATQEPETHDVNGMTTLTYRDPLLQTPQLTPQAAQFEVATLQSVGTLPDTFQANQSLCLPISVQLNQLTANELSVTVIIRNDLNIAVTQVSSVLATPDGRTSIDNTVGEVLTAFPVIDLPSGTPPGNYTVEIRLFDSETLSGYDLIAEGSPAGKTLTLGRWEIAAGAGWEDVPSPEGSLTLDAITVGQDTVRNGDSLYIRLDWRSQSRETQLPDAMLHAVDGSWSVSVPTTLDTYDNLITEWRRAQIPVEAQAGEAILEVEGFAQTETITIDFIPAITEAPSISNPVNLGFPGIGAILGYNLYRETDVYVVVEIIWQVEESPQIEDDYTVFVQFLNPDGDLIAQSDAIPAAGERPTPGWRPGEIIVDRHRFAFDRQTNLEGLTIIAGLYDDTFTRLLNSDGVDYIVLPTTLRPD